MIIEGIQSVTFINGIIKVSCTQINANGETVESGSLEIPAPCLNNVLNSIIAASKKIEEQISDTGEVEEKEKKDTKSKKKGKKDKAN